MRFLHQNFISLLFLLPFLPMSNAVQSSFGWAHSYNWEKFSEHTVDIPHWGFKDSPIVSKVLATSIAGYIEANVGGTRISYVTAKE